MKWRGRRQSDNVEDRRGAGGSRGVEDSDFHFLAVAGACGYRCPKAEAAAVAASAYSVFWSYLGLMWLFGIDPRVLLGGGQPGQMPDVQMPRPRNATCLPPANRHHAHPKANRPSSAKNRRNEAIRLGCPGRHRGHLGDDLSKSGTAIPESRKLVLFEGGVRSACGVGMAQMGPFYCPLDQNLYIDLSFYSELKNRFGAPGDFAQAYVIAHEVGHHVQTLLGISEEVQRAKMRMGQRDANALQVRMELQADCLAGVWAKHADRTKDILEPGDIDEALNAASAIGDDKMQRRAQGYVVPDAFTHGSSEQRVRWFRRGFETGNFNDCDTFSAPSL